MKKSVYSRPNKPLEGTVKKRNTGQDLLPRIMQGISGLNDTLEVDYSTECHVTPEREALSLLDYTSFNIDDHIDILEPQAGTGSILKVIERNFVNSNIMAVELNQKLFCTLQNDFSDKKNIRLVNSCFIDASNNLISSFDLVLMNPPFRYAKQHIEAALSCLKKGGELIAIVPSTYKHGDFITVKQLDQVFSNTKANTKIIKIES